MTKTWGKSGVMLATLQAALAIAGAFVLAAQGYPTGLIIAVGLIMVSALMTVMGKAAAVPCLIIGLAVGWLSIITNLPHIASGDELNTSCNGCNEIVPFFAGLAKLLVYGGILVGLAASVAVTAALRMFFRSKRLSSEQVRTNA